MGHLEEVPLDIRGDTRSDNQERYAHGHLEEIECSSLDQLG